MTIARAATSAEAPEDRADRETSACHAAADKAPGVPLRDALERLGQEVAELARMLERFEAAAGPHLLDAAGRSPDLVQQLQNLDHIGQGMVGLAAYLAALAPAAASGCRIDPGPATQVVMLADLAARLAFRDEKGAAAEALGRGDCELF